MTVRLPIEDFTADECRVLAYELERSTVSRPACCECFLSRVARLFGLRFTRP